MYARYENEKIIRISVFTLRKCLIILAFLVLSRYEKRHFLIHK